jgi:hypothetical protein
MEDDTPLIVRLLQSPEGQQVLQTLGTSLAETGDVTQALERAKQVAERNGVWDTGKVALFIDALLLLMKNFGKKK